MPYPVVEWYELLWKHSRGNYVSSKNAVAPSPNACAITTRIYTHTYAENLSLLRLRFIIKTKRYLLLCHPQLVRFIYLISLLLPPSLPSSLVSKLFHLLLQCIVCFCDFSSSAPLSLSTLASSMLAVWVNLRLSFDGEKIHFDVSVCVLSVQNTIGIFAAWLASFLLSLSFVRCIVFTIGV